MPTGTTGLEQQVLDLLVSEHGAPGESVADSDLDDMGFDSLVLVEFALTLSKKYGIDVRHEDLLEARTPAGIAALLADRGVPAPSEET